MISKGSAGQLARTGRSSPIVYKSIWHNFDIPLLLATVVLVLVGIVMIYSSYEASLPTPSTNWQDNTVLRQALFAVIGLIGYFAAAAFDYHILIALYRWIMAFVLVALVATLVLGQVLFGAQAWIQVQTWTFQPSELCKVLMIVVLARVLGQEAHRMESIGPFATSLITVAVPAVLIFLQSDFGMAMLLLATWLGMSFLAGVRWRHLIALAATGLLAVPVVWMQMADYMRDRIVLFFYPEQDVSGDSYNTIQALISIGSGGWWGKGLLHGTQSQLYFLRVRHTDYIFSVLAEELGFVGSLCIIALFAFIILRVARIATRARDPYGRLIAGGVAVMLLVQTVVNLGFNVNVLPVTGLTLPLISYGGTSLVTTLFALGLVQSVILRYKDPEPVLF
ncbi:MAG: FtsW/RodA/SpoVE family cell cycle protein [Anaerolineae bacterium]